MNKWEETKMLAKNLVIPDEEGILINKDEKHLSGKNNIHQLTSYELDLDKINGYDVRVVYSVCNTCKMIWNKRIVVFNNDDNFVYVHEITRKGERV